MNKVHIFPQLHGGYDNRKESNFRWRSVTFSLQIIKANFGIMCTDGGKKDCVYWHINSDFLFSVKLTFFVTFVLVSGCVSTWSWPVRGSCSRVWLQTCSALRSFLRSTVTPVTSAAASLRSGWRPAGNLNWTCGRTPLSPSPLQPALSLTL